MQLVDITNTVLYIIQWHMDTPGIVVYSDKWAAYNQVSSAGYAYLSLMV